MSRVINVDSAAKRRNQTRRTIAELLRRLGQKPDMDEEARDMLALIVFCLQDIDEGIETSATVWEGRNYWFKAEELRQRWSWARKGAAQLRDLLQKDEPGQIPVLIASLLPHFADVRVNRYVRQPHLWQGCHQRLLQAYGRRAEA